MGWSQNCFNHRKNIYNLWNVKNSNVVINIIKNFLESFIKSFFDIDLFLNRLNRKINVFDSRDINNKSFGKKSSFIVMILFILILVWIASGLYTIKEAERGVVLRFGKFHHLVQPGLNWKPTFIDIVIPVNVESVRELAASGMMLTSDENVVRVEMNVQYRVTDPKNYLFSVTNADYSLRQATDSALRGVIGKYNMDRILTEGRTVVRSDTRRVLENTIYPYNMGITLLDVNFQTARPPEEVKAAFDDAIAARENEQQYIREAEAYANEVQPRANGKAQRILEEGRAYKARTILEAQGEVQRFCKILPEYRAAPEITRQRLYINAMERILGNTQKIFINEKNINNLLLLSTEQLYNLKNEKNHLFKKSCDKKYEDVSLNREIIKNDSRSKKLKLKNNNDEFYDNNTKFYKKNFLDKHQNDRDCINIIRKQGD